MHSASRSESVGELTLVIARLRRAMSQFAGAADPDLPFAKLEVVRLLHKSPGMRVQDVADGLGIAANTASTLVTQLASMGLVERRRDKADARVARLFVTRAATARKARRRDRREAAVFQAVERLSTTDRELIVAAVPALNRLLQELEVSGGRDSKQP
jgi:DNA-binding MarR family transcriptional regulator